MSSPIFNLENIIIVSSTTLSFPLILNFFIISEDEFGIKNKLNKIQKKINFFIKWLFFIIF